MQKAESAPLDLPTNGKHKASIDLYNETSDL